MRIGLLLPHFSDECRWEDVIGLAPRIEALGFDSVWVRDNLNYTGHGFDGHGHQFVDPFVTLSAVSGCTSTLRVGTAVLAPFRHPLLTAQLVGSLTWASRGRFELGIGPGAPRAPFDAVGAPYDHRIGLCRDTARVVRLLSDGNSHDYASQTCQFDTTTIVPSASPTLRIWYGGASSASVRRAVEYCDGILSGQCPFVRWDAACDRLRRSAPEGRRMVCGSIPLVSLGETKRDARRKIDDRAGPLLQYLNSRWKLELTDAEQGEGALIVGTVDDLVDALMSFQGREADLVVLDLRLIMREFPSMIDLIGKEVLPAVAAKSE